MDLGSILNTKTHDAIGQINGEDSVSEHACSSSQASSQSESRPHGVQLPPLDQLLRQTAVESAGFQAVNAAQQAGLAPRPMMDLVHRGRRQSAPIAAPYHSMSASPSPALSNASTASAMTSPQPRTPPPMTNMMGHASHAGRIRGKNSRDHRPAYRPEEEHFIWYHRVDLNLEWGDIRRLYNDEFPDRKIPGHQGIQCKYYRCTESAGVPKCRARDRSAGAPERYGLRSWYPNLWYRWMQGPAPSHLVQMQGPKRMGYVS